MATFCGLVMLAPLDGQIVGQQDSSSEGSFGSESEQRMPDGRSRTLMILKSDAKKSRADITKVIELATLLKEEIEANQFHTVDLQSVRKAEEIITLVRRVKSRLTRRR